MNRRETVILADNNHRYKEGLTTSIGISASPHDRIGTHDDLISCADQALFAAKNSGRNRAAIFRK